MDAERLARITLGAGALAFAGPGLAFVLAPALPAAALGLAPAGATAWSDLRAVMGGLELGVAALLARGARRPALRPAALGLLLATLAGMLLGRGLSLLADGVPGPLGLALGAVELALLLAAVRAAQRLRAARLGA